MRGGWRFARSSSLNIGFSLAICSTTRPKSAYSGQLTPRGAWLKAVFQSEAASPEKP